MKVGKAMWIAVLAIVIACVAYSTALIRHGFSARGNPSAIEKLAATTARRMSVPSGYRRLHNPFPAMPENLSAGMAHFADHCSTCHGNDGCGITMFGNGLYPKPPDMRLSETKNKSDGELYYIIENGVRLSGMPAFGEEHTGGGDDDTWKLVLFIRHLPKISDAELQQMTQLNPKTDEERQEEQREEEFLRGESPQTQGNKTPATPRRKQ